MSLNQAYAAALLLTSLVLANGQLQVTVQASELDQRTGMACSFLKNLQDPSLQLVRETLSKRVYHVASDNLLAWKALGGCNPDISRSIKASISRNPCCNQGNDSMHEAVFGVQIPLPIHTANEYNVTKDWPAITGNYSVLWENHNGTATLSPFAYADVAVYTALELERRGNETGAVEMVGVLNRMWDGKGMIDEAYKNGNVGERGIYQTFKVALYMFLLKRFSFPVPSELTDALVRMQGPDGGFHTGYDPNLTYAGTDENAETTSLAIIALSEQLPPDFLYAAAVLASSIALIILVFVIRRRRIGGSPPLGRASLNESTGPARANEPPNLGISAGLLLNSALLENLGLKRIPLPLFIWSPRTKNRDNAVFAPVFRVFCCDFRAFFDRCVRPWPRWLPLFRGWDG